MLLGTLLIGIYIYGLFKGWLLVKGNLTLAPLLLLGFTGARLALFCCFALPAALYYGLKGTSSEPITRSLLGRGKITRLDLKREAFSRGDQMNRIVERIVSHCEPSF